MKYTNKYLNYSIQYYTQQHIIEILQYNNKNYNNKNITIQ